MVADVLAIKATLMRTFGPAYSFRTAAVGGPAPKLANKVVKFPEPDTITQREADILRQGETPEAALFHARSMLRAAYTILLGHWDQQNARHLLVEHAAICGTLRKGESVSLDIIDRKAAIEGETQP